MPLKLPERIRAAVEAPAQMRLMIPVVVGVACIAIVALILAASAVRNAH